MFRTDIQNTTTVLSLAIIDNTDNIGLVRGDVFANEAHIKYIIQTHIRQSNPIMAVFSLSNFSSAVLRIDENKAYINSHESAISGY